MILETMVTVEKCHTMLFNVSATICDGPDHPLTLFINVYVTLFMFLYIFSQSVTAERT